jgi:hypothetical protein
MTCTTLKPQRVPSLRASPGPPAWLSVLACCRAVPATAAHGRAALQAALLGALLLTVHYVDQHSLRSR